MGCNKKLQLLAAVAVCSLRFASASSADSVDTDAGEAGLIQGGPADLYLYKPAPPGAATETGTVAGSEKKQKGLLKKMKQSSEKKKVRKVKSEDSVRDDSPSRASEKRRQNLQKAMNILSALVEAILKFIDCFRESGILESCGRGAAKNGAFREATEEELEPAIPPNCAIGAVMKATEIYEQVEGRSPMRELTTVEPQEELPSYFVADAKVLRKQALQLTTWLAIKVEEVKHALLELRDEGSDSESDSDSDDEAPIPVVVISESSNGRAPSPVTVLIPEEPTAAEVDSA